MRNGRICRAARLSSEPDLSGQSAALAAQAKTAKDAKDAKDAEKLGDR